MRESSTLPAPKGSGYASYYWLAQSLSRGALADLTRGVSARIHRHRAERLDATRMETRCSVIGGKCSRLRVAGEDWGVLVADDSKGDG